MGSDHVPTETERTESLFFEAGGNIEIWAIGKLLCHLEQSKLGKAHSIDIDRV
jgi:hypothetical protein